MSSDPKQQLSESYDLEQATLAAVPSGDAEEMLNAVARAEHLASRQGSSGALHEQAASDVGEKLAELSAKHDIELPSLVPNLKEDAALQAALADAEKDPDAPQGAEDGAEEAELSAAEQEEKQRLEAQHAALEDKEGELAEAERDRIETELADLAGD